MTSRVILVTGATGFVGSHIAGALVVAGHRVRCSVRRTSDTKWIDPLDVETVELDLAQGDAATDAALRDVDTVVHAGGITRALDESTYMSVNAHGTERLAAAAVRAGVGRFIFISSLAARGPDELGHPNSPYGKSKLEAERRLAEAGGSMETVVLRPGGVYGPRDTDLLPLFRMAARGLLVAPRSAPPIQPIYVDDVASATALALEARPPAKPLPLAGDRTHSWSEVAEFLREATGSPLRMIRAPSAVFWSAGLLAEVGARVTGSQPSMDRRRARDMSDFAWTCDTSPAEGALGWKPAIPLRDGLARTAEWYRDVGWL